MTDLADVGDLASPLVSAPHNRLIWDGPVGRSSSTAAELDETLVARLLDDLRQVNHVVADTSYDAFADLLQTVRVALVNPYSAQARSLMRAIARYDAIRQPIPSVPDGSGAD